VTSYTWPTDSSGNPTGPLVAGASTTFEVKAGSCFQAHDIPTLNPIENIDLACDQAAPTDMILSGIGTPGATVTITNTNGAVIGTSVVYANGSWYTISPYVFTPATYTLTATSVLGNSTLSSVARTFTVKACGVTYTPPTISVSNAIISCDQTSSPLAVTGLAPAGATVTIKNASGTTLGTATVGTSGTYSITTSSLGLATHTLYASSTIGNSTLESARTNVIVSQLSCNSVSSSGPGGGGSAAASPTFAAFVVTPAPASATPASITTTTSPKVTTTIKPYWQRFSKMTAPTTKFLGTGPSALLDRTTIKTNRRVETISTKTEKSFTKRRFLQPLLGL
jgi:hypothetical protein